MTPPSHAIDRRTRRRRDRRHRHRHPARACSSMYDRLDPAPRGPRRPDQVRHHSRGAACRDRRAPAHRRPRRRAVRRGVSEAQTITFTSSTLTTMVTISPAVAGPRPHRRVDRARRRRPGRAAAQRQRRAATVADADGRFVFDDVPHGLAQLRAPAAGRRVPVPSSLRRSSSDHLAHARCAVDGQRAAPRTRARREHHAAIRARRCAPCAAPRRWRSRWPTSDAAARTRAISISIAATMAETARAGRRVHGVAEALRARRAGRRPGADGEGALPGGVHRRPGRTVRRGAADAWTPPSSCSSTPSPTTDSPS